MTRLLEHVLEKVAALPEAQQDECARLLLRLVGSDTSPLTLTAEEEADLIAAEGEILRGELAFDDEVQTLWAKYGAKGDM